MKLKLILVAILSAFCNDVFSFTPITSVAQVPNTSNVKIDWGETDVNLTSPKVSLIKYQIQYSTGGGTPVVIDNISAGLRTYTVSSLLPNVEYSFEVFEVIRVEIPPIPGQPNYIDTPIGSGVSKITLSSVNPPPPPIPLNHPPVSQCKSLIKWSLDACWVNLSATEVNNGSYDVDGDLLSFSIYPEGPFNKGIHQVILTVQDPSGLTSSCLTSVEVQDRVAPTVRTRDIQLDLDESGKINIYPELLDNGSFDNCEIVRFELSKYSFSCNETGTWPITVTAWDEAGNSSSAISQVTIREVNPPIVYTSEITLYLNEEGMALISKDSIRLYETCELQSISFSQDTFYCDQENVSIAVFTKDIHQNQSIDSIKISVIDTLKPKARAIADTFYLDSLGMVKISPEMLDHGSSDNCSVNKIWLSNDSFNCDQTGPNSVTLYVEDIHGLIDSTVVEVTIKDSISPVIIANGSKLKLNDNGKVQLSISEIDMGSFDNCGIDTLILSQMEFDCSQLGENAVELMAVDYSGNRSSKSLIFEIFDYSPPILVVQPIEKSLPENGILTMSSEDFIVSASDNCEVTSTTIDKSTFGCFELGTQLVTVTVTDGSGNVSTETTELTIKDDLGVCVCSYAILASEKVVATGTKFLRGGVGTYQNDKTVELNNIDAGSDFFVKSKNLRTDDNNILHLAAVAPTPIDFEENTFKDKTNLVVKSDENSSSSANHFKKLKIKKNGILSLNSNEDYYVRKLVIRKGGNLNMNSYSNLHLIKKPRMGKEVTLNKNSMSNLFSEKKVVFREGSNVRASVFSLESIQIKGGNDIQITGLFSAKNITVGSNVSWTGGFTDCDRTTEENNNLKQGIPLIVEDAPEENERRTGSWDFNYGPNPTSSSLSIEFTDVQPKVDHIILRDRSGKIVNLIEPGTILSNYVMNLQNLPEGLYYLSIQANDENRTVRIFLKKD